MRWMDNMTFRSIHVADTLRFPQNCLNIGWLSIGLLLIIACSTASAEWARLYQAEQGAAYVDWMTKQVSGNNITVWVLRDIGRAHPMDSRIRSMKMQNEYDCGGHKFRTLFQAAYSGRMGGGDMLGSSSRQQDWRPIPPETNIETESKLICQ